LYILINDKNMADMFAGEFGSRNQDKKGPLYMFEAMLPFTKEDRCTVASQK
jgi:hypothetical protein